MTHNERLQGQSSTPIFSHFRNHVSMVAVASSIFAGGAFAQDQDGGDDASVDDGGSFLEEVIVVGTRKKRIIDVSNPVTAISDELLQQQAPRNVADALINVPSLNIDPSQGNSNNDFRFRGIGEGGTQFLEIEEDGIPIQRDGPDFWYRVHNGTAGIDVTRGGISPILRTAAIGGVINFRHREGSRDEMEGDIYIQGSDFNQRRVEAYVGGPLTDQLTFALSGYVTSDNGVQETDFKANDGFNVYGNMKYHFDDDSGYMKVSARHTKEDNFTNGLGIPVQGTLTDATEIPGGPKIGQQSLVGNDIAQFINFNTPFQSEAQDIRGGEGTDFFYIGSEIYKSFDSGLEFVARNRYTESESTFAGYFAAGFATSTPDITTGSELAQNIISAGFPSAGGVGIYQQAFPAGFNPTGYRLESAAGVLDQGTYAVNDLNGNGIIEPGETTAASTATALANGNGLFLPAATFIQSNPFTSFQQDIEVSYSWETDSGSSHRIAAGYYYMDMQREQDGIVSIFLSDLKPAADRVDLILTNDAGDEVAITDDGTLAHNIFPGGNRLDDEIDAIYVNYEGNFGALTIDGGLRYDSFKLNVMVFGSENFFGDGPTQTPVPEAGTTSPAILAIQQRTELFNPNNGLEIDEDFWSGTIGANYLFEDTFGLYGRYTRGGLPQRGRVAQVDQFELGTRWQSGDVSLAANLFYIRQEGNVVTSGVIVDGNQTVVAVETDRESRGLELEGVWTPTAATTISFNATFQDPKLKTGGIVTDLNSGANVGELDLAGNRLNQQPRLLGTFNAAHDFSLGDAGTLTAVATVRYIGGRFVDLNNTAKLASYAMLNLGLIYENEEGWYARVNVQNLNNTTPIAASQGSATSVGGVFTNGASGFYGRPINGRNITFGIGYRF